MSDSIFTENGNFGDGVDVDIHTIPSEPEPEVKDDVTDNSFL